MAASSPVKTFGMQLGRAVISAFTVVLLSRWMGAAGRGELSLILFWVNILMILNEYVGGSSLGNLWVKHPIEKLIPPSILWAVLTTALGMACFYFQKGSVYAIQIGLIAMPLALLTIQYNVYQGTGMIRERNWLQLGLELGKFSLVCAFYMLLNHANFTKLRISTAQAVYIQSAATWVVLIVSFVILRNYLPQFFAFNKKPARELFISGFWAQNGQLVQFLNYRLSLLILGKISGIEATGIYSNALLIADTIWIFGNSFGTIAHTRMLRSANEKFRADITLRYTTISTAGTLLACLCIFLIPQSVFIGIFGKDFAALKSTALWLIPAILSLGCSTVFSHYLHATDRFKILLFANLSGLILQLILALILVPRYGLTGACIAADVGFAGILIFVFTVFRKENPEAKWHGVFQFSKIWKIILRL